MYVARLSSPVGHQDVAAAVNPREDPLAHPSNNYGAKKRNQNVDLNSGGDVSFTTASQFFVALPAESRFRFIRCKYLKDIH